jgi:hypothetical protein
MSRLGVILLADMTFQHGAELRLPAFDDETDDFAFEGATDLEILLGVARARVRLMQNSLPITSSGRRVPGGKACSMMA